jgi:hypothetical protein
MHGAKIRERPGLIRLKVFLWNAGGRKMTIESKKMFQKPFKGLLLWLIEGIS